MGKARLNLSRNLMLAGLSGAFITHLDEARLLVLCQPSPLSSPASPARAHPEMKILLVDDHSLFRAGLKLLLQRLGDAAEIFEAKGIPEALTLAAQCPDFDLILLDLHMPDGHGLDGLGTLRRAFPATAVVLLSAVSSPDLVDEARAKGAQGFISKAIDPEEMLAAVRRVLAGELLFPETKRRSVALDISPRQREVLALLCKGHPNKEIGRCLGLSENTVRSHVAVIFRELGVNTRTEAAMVARRHGLD